MTAAGHAALQAELSDRIRIKRRQIAERIQQAIGDDPNLVENSEYQAALTEQGLDEARIADLEAKLARAEVIDVSKLSGETIKFGAGTRIQARNELARLSASPKPILLKARFR